MSPHPPSLSHLFWTFLKIGSTAFGGLMSLIAMVENIVVVNMKLLRHEDILDGISLTTFLPGPISTNVVVYVGHRIRGKLGALVSLIGVILPSFCLITGLAAIYFKFGAISQVDRLFLGFIPTVTAVIVSAAWQMSRKTIKDWRQLAIAITSAILLIGVGGIYFTLFLMITSGWLGWFLFRPVQASASKEAVKPWRYQKRLSWKIASDIATVPVVVAPPFARSWKTSPELASTARFCVWRRQAKTLKHFAYLLLPIPYYLQVRRAAQFFPQISLSACCFSLIFLGSIGKSYLRQKITHLSKSSFFPELKSQLVFYLTFICFLAYAVFLLIIKKSTVMYLLMTFATISVMLFGGAYVGIPLIEEIVVGDRHWLTSQQFAYGIALGQITPGPIVISAAFIGYKVQGVLGALVATIGIFTPPFFLTLSGTHILERCKQSRQIQAAMKGIRPAVIGMIFAAAWIVGQTAKFNIVSILIFSLSLFALIRWRINIIWLILGAGITGLLLY